MKTILNYGMKYTEDGTEKDEIFFSKQSLIKSYIEMLDSRRPVSSLRLYQWTGKTAPKYDDITDRVNVFLMR